MSKNSEEKKKSFRSVQDEFLILLEEGLRTAGRITKREFDRVSDVVKEKLEKKYGKEKVENFHSRIRNNWQETVNKFQASRGKTAMDDSVRKGKEISIQILTNLSDAIKRAAETLEAGLSDKITFHAGQVVDKGVYLCNDCRKIQEVKRRRKLSACPECGASEFRMV